MNTNRLDFKFSDIPYFSDDNFRELIEDDTIKEKLPLNFIMESNQPIKDGIRIRILVNLNSDKQKEKFINAIKEELLK